MINKATGTGPSPGPGPLEMLTCFDDHDAVIVHDQRIVTRREMRDLIRIGAAAMRDNTSHPGDRVLLLLPNSVDLLLAYYSCLAAGLVAVPVNERLGRAEIQRVIEHAKPTLVVTSASLQSDIDLESIAAGLTLIRDTDLVSGQSARASAGQDWRPPAWPDEHDAIIFYTSGSTGQPKGAVYTHGTLRHNSRIYRQQFKLHGSDRSVLVHCMAHNFVFSQLTVPFLDAGGSVHVVDFGNVEQTIDALHRGATFLSLIPWFALSLFERCLAQGRGRGSLRVCMMGGDRPPERAYQLCRQVFGTPALQNIGMTEVNTYAVNMALPGSSAEGALGSPLPEVKIEIRAPDGQLCPPGVSGEIWVHTPARMDRYWNDPDATQKVLQHGWLATGDSGHFDASGILWFDARIRNIIICDGDNIYPGEVEKEIARHPAVCRVVVFGVPHELHGETVAAALVTRDGAEVSLEALQAFLKGRLGAAKIPVRLVKLDQLPSSSNGKTDLQAIRERLSRAS